MSAAITGKRKARLPTFRVEVTVGVFIDPDSNGYRPDLRLALTYYCSYRDDVGRGGKSAAEWALSKAGVPAERLAKAEYETALIEVYALESRFVRNPDRDPVIAFLDDFGMKNRDRLIKQRRLFPNSNSDLMQLYGDQPAAVPTPAEGAPA